MDAIFMAVDGACARSVGKAAKPKSNRAVVGDEKKNRLNRVEFVLCLIRVSIHRYILSGHNKDVSEALQRLIELCHSLIQPNLLAAPNVFRRSHCYLPETCRMLAYYEQPLRSLFDTIASAGREVAGHGRELLTMSCWQRFMRSVRLVGADVSVRDATLAFAWSRMCVVDPRTSAGQLRDSHLPFEGFLEALCRVAAMKSLPTDAEISAAGCRDAADFLERLRVEDAAALDELVTTRATPWGSEPSQPLARCIDHLMSIIVQAIDHSENRALEKKEVVRFWEAATGDDD